MPSAALWEVQLAHWAARGDAGQLAQVATLMRQQKVRVARGLRRVWRQSERWVFAHVCPCVIGHAGVRQGTACCAPLGLCWSQRAASAWGTAGA